MTRHAHREVVLARGIAQGHGLKLPPGWRYRRASQPPPTHRPPKRGEVTLRRRSAGPHAFASIELPLPLNGRFCVFFAFRDRTALRGVELANRLHFYVGYLPMGPYSTHQLGNRRARVVKTVANARVVSRQCAKRFQAKGRHVAAIESELASSSTSARWRAHLDLSVVRAAHMGLSARSPLGRRALRLRGGQSGGGAQKGDDDVDEGLYSRQLYVMGHAAQRSLATSAILMIGLTGLGAEIGKNIVLAGVGSIDVHDDTVTTNADLSSSFLLSESDLSLPRSEHAVERLAPLNPHVRVGRIDGPLTPEKLRGYTTIVAVDRSLPEQIELNAAAREAGCKFVSASSQSVCGSVFCDFGDDFEVADADGEQPREALLERVEVAEETELICVQEQPHGLQAGDVVRLEEVGGMAPLGESGRTFEVRRVVDRHRLVIGDTRPFGSYTGGGRLVQVKQALRRSFTPLRDAIINPRLMESATITRKRALTTHACFACAHLLPADTPAGSERAAAAMLAAVRESGLIAEKDIVHEIVGDFGRGASGRLSAISAFIGGVAAQEVLKACSGRFTPLDQFFYYEACDALPSPRPTEQVHSALLAVALPGARLSLYFPPCSFYTHARRHSQAYARSHTPSPGRLPLICRSSPINLTFISRRCRSAQRAATVTTVSALCSARAC